MPTNVTRERPALDSILPLSFFFMPPSFFKSLRDWFTERFQHLLSEGQLWRGQQKGSPLPTQKPAFQLVPFSENLMQPSGVIVPGLPSPGHRL